VENKKSNKSTIINCKNCRNDEKNNSYDVLAHMLHFNARIVHEQEALETRKLDIGSKQWYHAYGMNRHLAL